MNANEYKVQDYVYHFLKEMDNLYSFADKHVIFLSYEPNINNALIVKNLFKAKKVYYINPDYEFEDIENGDVILAGLQNDELPFINDKTIDLVIGIEILEHINNPKIFFGEIKRILKEKGEVELQGNPMWTCHHGHHLWIENKYIFYENTNPFEDWEHLSYKNKKEMEKALIKKGLPKDDCSEIADWIYNPIEISRCSPSEIIEAATGISEQSANITKTNLSSFVAFQYKNDEYEYFIKKVLSNSQQNEFYKKASEKYSEEDLQTYHLIIKIKSLKNTTDNQEQNKHKTQNIEFLNDWLFDLIKTFNTKHNIDNKSILNLSMFNNVQIKSFFEMMGAKSVISVLPVDFVSEKSLENIKNKKFDIIFGLDSLNYLENPELFFSKIKEVSQDNTVYYLSGYMPYSYGKNNSFITEREKSSYPIPLWSHLTVSNEQELRKKFKQYFCDEEQIKLISERYFSKLSGEIKSSPSEIYSIACKYISVYLRRIFKYLPKNDYYNQALEKYTEDDLNTERFILLSDFPNLNWFEELNINQYLKDNLADINRKYKIQNKKVLNVTPFINKQISEAIEALGAAKVVSLSNYDTGMELSGGKNIQCLNQVFEDISNINEKFDIIYGLDVLEHIKDVRSFYINLKNLIEDDGIICIQGSPLWPSDNGHNCMLDLDCGTLKTGYENLSIAPWEHLGYDTKDEMKNALLDKKFSEEDAEKISDYMFNSDEINRLSFLDFINILNEIDGVHYGSKKILNYTEENEFYKKASEKYSHEELRTKELKLFIRKNKQS